MTHAWHNGEIWVISHAVPNRLLWPEGHSQPHPPLIGWIDGAGRSAAWAEIEQKFSHFEGPSGFEGPCEMIVAVGRQVNGPRPGGAGRYWVERAVAPHTSQTQAQVANSSCPQHAYLIAERGDCQQPGSGLT